MEGGIEKDGGVSARADSSLHAESVEYRVAEVVDVRRVQETFFLRCASDVRSVENLPSLSRYEPEEATSAGHEKSEVAGGGRVASRRLPELSGRYRGKWSEAQRDQRRRQAHIKKRDIFQLDTHFALARVPGFVCWLVCSVFSVSSSSTPHFFATCSLHHRWPEDGGQGTVDELAAVGFPKVAGRKAARRSLAVTSLQELHSQQLHVQYVQILQSGMGPRF